MLYHFIRGVNLTFHHNQFSPTILYFPIPQNMLRDAFDLIGKILDVDITVLYANFTHKKYTFLIKYRQINNEKI